MRIKRTHSVVKTQHLVLAASSRAGLKGLRGARDSSCSHSSIAAVVAPGLLESQADLLQMSAAVAAGRRATRAALIPFAAF